MNYLLLKEDFLQDFGLGVVNWTLLFICPYVITVKVIWIEKIETSVVV